MYKKFPVSADMIPYLEKVFLRDHISYKVLKDETTIFIKAKLSDDQFLICVEDAECEIQRANNNPFIPVYSYHTLQDPEKMKHLMALHGTNEYQILQKDKNKYL